MTKKQAIMKAIDDSSYIGSHRHETFERILRECGYKITRKNPKGRVQ